ncbi:MAG: hypothetical protein ACTSXZ_01800 [Alphaproteobacteria bacterium]
MTEQTARGMRLQLGLALLVWLALSALGWTFLAGMAWAAGIIGPA